MFSRTLHCSSPDSFSESRTTPDTVVVSAVLLVIGYLSLAIVTEYLALAVRTLSCR